MLTKNYQSQQPTEWEKIFANKETNKGLNLQNIQTVHAAQYKKTNKPTPKPSKKKKGADLNRHFSKKD